MGGPVQPAILLVVGCGSRVALHVAAKVVLSEDENNPEENEGKANLMVKPKQIIVVSHRIPPERRLNNS